MANILFFIFLRKSDSELNFHSYADAVNELLCTFYFINHLFHFLHQCVMYGNPAGSSR